eukprot:TRINITY_DN9766_c0_g1_i2.p1 TRINITY_DN9766_c0_g1~~TRINITY_DN9766_c0_g1_i2.p1  ORF type:complete len:352 (-),score=22.50 TRINITY_DN9766_c0_g1_i2:32-1087(-)
MIFYMISCFENYQAISISIQKLEGELPVFFQIASSFLNVFLIRIVFCWIALFCILMKIQLIFLKIFEMKKFEQNSNLGIYYIYLILLIVQFSLIGCYFTLKELFFEGEKMTLVTTILPRISYSLTFLLILLGSQIDYKKFNFSFSARTLIHFIPFLNSLFLILGSQSLAIFLFSLIFILSIQKIFRSVKFELFLPIFLGQFSIQLWLFFGNRPKISALNFNSAYIGFEKFQTQISGLLLLLNFLGPFIISLFFFMVFSNQNTKSIKTFLISSNKLSFKQLEINKWKFFYQLIIFQSYFLVEIISVCLNCTLNQKNLLLVEDFAPKFLFDLIIFIAINFQIILILIYYFKQN